jgi:dihydrofolate synthase / folylpolyglutamate synthase
MQPPERATDSNRWTEARAEGQLRSLELFGMRFGLDRMRRMMTVLGSPERDYPTIHVLGTNGKTSTTRMIAAILEGHGLRAAAYLSPHLVSYSERVRIGGQELESDAFVAAIARASWAAERVNRTLGEGDHVTQFELLTAAALWHIAQQHVDVAVIEAGLGGRYDATSVIDSPITVLTNVGLEHTRWLGPTVRDIAEEKLAVLQPGGTLALAAELAPEAMEVAERVAGERGARILRARAAGAGRSVNARGGFQRRNFALACVAAEAHLTAAGRVLSEPAVAAVAASIEIPGRMQLLSEDPPTIIDGAHNPDAVRALVESLPEVLGEGPLALVLGVLEDKDAASMLAALLPLVGRAWFTSPSNSRALPPAALQSLARQLGFEAVVTEPKPARALAEAQQWAREHGGSVLATGSVYLVGELIGAGRRSQEPQERAAPKRSAAG